MLPFNTTASSDEFAAVRNLLDSCGYTAERVAERVGIRDIHEFKSIGEGRKAPPDVNDALDLLIRLFMDGFVIPMAEVRRLLPPGGFEALLALGVIGRHPDGEAHYAASLQLYPVDGVYIASDLDVTTPGLRDPKLPEAPDHVFSALTSLTGNYLDQLPATPCGTFLEVCAGTGVAALLAAKNYAGHAWAADITERSTGFARFNAALNGIENFTAVQGDLFEPVSGRQFDRIVAHPPYVPAPETRMIYRDGGEDGEWIIRRILAELPDYLAPGGRFYLTCVSSDRKGAPVEDRIRSMIGEREKEFDLLLIAHYGMSPGEYYSRLALSGRYTFQVAEERIRLFRRLEAEAIVYISLVLQRHATPREAFTLRRDGTEASQANEAEWLLTWKTRLAEEDVAPMLLDSRPRLLSNPKLEVIHRVENGEWKIDSSRIRVDYPYVRTVDISFNGSLLLTLCDGSHTGREILARLRASGAMPQDVPEASFAEFLRELITEGVLGLGNEPTPSVLPTSSVVPPPQPG